MTNNGYETTFRCKTCGYISDDVIEIKEHSKIPLGGLELEVGDVLGIKDLIPLVQRTDTPEYYEFPFAVVTEPAKINEEHFRDYDYSTFCFKKDFGEQALFRDDAFDHPLFREKLQDSLTTLSEKDFELLCKTKVYPTPIFLEDWIKDIYLKIGRNKEAEKFKLKRKIL